MQSGEGERLHDARRRRFWTILGALLVLGAVTGALAGAFLDLEGVAQGQPSRGLQVAAIAGVALFAFFFVYGSYRFFAAVDELELADNLWGSLIGFYTYAILFPAWWALARVDVVPEPNQWVVFGASMFAGLATYVFRKVTLR
jgi:hypothetical protein